jgi:hypothetical protein
MSKSNDTSKHAALEDHNTLADSELDAVSGGFFADYVKQLLANSGSSFVRIGGDGGDISQSGKFNINN